MDYPSQLISMVNRRGRVIWIKKWELEGERAKGSRVIINPKEDYYPTYDLELNKESIVPDNLIENIEASDVLEVEEL